MSDKKKTEEEVISELADMRLLIEKAVARQRHAEKALREIQPQLQQAQKMETLEHWSQGWPMKSIIRLT